MTPLRQRMLNDMTVRGLAENTKKSYSTPSPDWRVITGAVPTASRPKQVQDYLIHLHEQRGLTWQSCNCVRHGIRFFYRITLRLPEPHFYLPGAKTPSTLPEILNRDELLRLFTVTTNPKHRALLMTAYAAGLRCSELTCLRVSDIDSGRMLLRVEQGKGSKDRYVPLSPRLLEQLRAYWRRMRPAPLVVPEPHRGPTVEPPHGPAHMYDLGKKKAGIEKSGGIHTLRHCYATGLLEAGVELPVIQRRLGHTSIRSHLAVSASGPGQDIGHPLPIGPAGVPANLKGLSGGARRSRGAGPAAGPGDRRHPRGAGRGVSANASRSRPGTAASSTPWSTAERPRSAGSRPIASSAGR